MASPAGACLSGHLPILLPELSNLPILPLAAELFAAMIPVFLRSGLWDARQFQLLN